MTVGSEKGKKKPKKGGLGAGRRNFEKTVPETRVEG